MVELNMDDIRELKRITALEMQGTLDADGVKAFVEATWLDTTLQTPNVENIFGEIDEVTQ